MKRLRIGYIGNFIPKFSTENDRKWSFEKLGHEVVTFQENQTKDVDLLRALPFLDLLIYSHTHDPAFTIYGLREVFKQAFYKGIPTASVHLDRWAWLKRVEDVGNEATWFTQYIFMADGSPEAVELYKKHKLNWHFLKAGVVERDCYLALPDRLRFPHDIVFTGSKGYHPEYPERPALIDFLHREYGNSFAHYGNDGIRVVRGDELNTLYASAKIVIGDSCFGGRPSYVSDRYYEVRGRGGFLLHPYVEGVDSMGVANYNPRDLNDLKKQIDYYLFLNTQDRELMREAGFKWVKENETYTNRAKEMLAVIFGN